MHWLVTGMSGRGKGALMKSVIIPDYRRRGIKVAVLDPIEMPGWNADYQTSDPYEFMEVIRSSRNIVSVIDEYPHFQADWEAWRLIEKCATIMRNFGQLHYALAQRCKMVPPNVRNQCDKAIIFEQQAEDIEYMAYRYKCAEILEATDPVKFPPGTFLMIKPNQKPVKARVILSK